MINKSGFTCTPHAANLSLVTVCTMHFLKAIPNAGKYLEYSIEGEDYYPWQKNLFSKQLTTTCFQLRWSSWSIQKGCGFIWIQKF